VRIADGKWAELCGTSDDLNLMQQLGVIPSMEEIQKKRQDEKTVEENKAVVRRFGELVNQKDIKGIRELLAPEFVAHRTTGDMSRDDWEREGEWLFANYPDYRYIQEHMVAEGDKVAYREICSGTHAPTGKKVEWINTYIV